MYISKNLLALSLLASTLHASNLYNTMSLQGVTGVINTPTAEVIESGEVELQYSNQVDYISGSLTKQELTADQYFVNFGLFPNLEVIGRLANIEYKDKSRYRSYGELAYIRDLAASFKYQIPYYHDYLPHIAIGINDLGGQASHYDSKYIVATKEYGFVRGSVGYGFDSINMLDGAFGSLEVKATDWATLLAEYDAADTQVGLRLNTPANLSDYVDVAFLAKANLSDASQRYSFGLNVRMALGDDHHDSRIYHSENSLPTPTVPTQTEYKTEALKEKLIAIGLENIDISEGGSTLYVAYENNIFEHNELDALGVVLGSMVSLEMPYDAFTIVIKRSNQKVRQVSGSLVAYRALIKNYSIESEAAFRDSLAVTAPASTTTALKVENANSSYLKTRLRLYPGLITYVGTEYGAFDYLVSLRTAFAWNLYKGWDLGVMSDFPAIASDDLDRKTGRYRSANKGNKLKSIMIHRSDVFGNFVNLASAGLFRDYWVGFENFSYMFDNHTLGVKYAYFRSRDKVEVPGYIAYEPYIDERYIYVANYSYYHDKWDTLLELTAGKFFNDDRGYEIKAKRYFGDTAVGFFYQHADEQYIGISIEVPLTPRKVADSYFQVKGKSDYQYHLRTTVNDDDGRNTLAPGGLLRASREFDIEPNFLNRNRLSESYIKKHILRLRDAYAKYVVGE